MGVHSGKFGVVNGVSGVRNWSINETSATQPYVASHTKGGTGRKPGVKDWTGQYAAFGGAPDVFPGEAFTFEGYSAPDNDTEGGNGKTYSGDAIVDQVAITWDFATGAIIAHTVSFSGNGALTEATGLYSDNTAPDFDSSIEGAKVLLVNEGSSGSSSGDDDVELCGITTMTLTLTAANQAYANSCTSGRTKRKAGNFDWTLSITLQENSMAAVPVAIGESVQLHLYTDASTFWNLKWGIVKEYTGLTVDRETGAIIGMTMNLEMNGFLDGDEGLVQYGETQYWPEAA